MDTGLDETSCFFADDDGLQVEHGHLFDGFRLETNGNVSIVFDNYSFAYDLSRRKVSGENTKPWVGAVCCDCFTQLLWPPDVATVVEPAQCQTNSRTV